MQVTDAQVDRFALLYQGFPDRYGRFTIRRDQPPGAKMEGDATTVFIKDDPLTPDVWRAHLEGKRGIGIVPLMPDNTVHFSAIDVDQYHGPDGWLESIAKRVRWLPVTCTGSKSGGLHIWLHSFKGMPAKLAVDFLKKVRALLGLTNALEIFPKQIERTSPQDVGNWINLPMFGDARAVIWYGEDQGALKLGPCDLDSFLSLAERNATLATESRIREYLDELRAAHTPKGAEDLPEIQDGPPCLQRRLYGDPESRAMYRKLRADDRLSKDEAAELQKKTAPDCPPGVRNAVLFNYGVYLSLRHNGDTDTVLRALKAINRERKIGLDEKELIGITRSVTRKDYHFQCNDQALADHCDRERCQLRKYGIARSTKLSFESIAPENVRMLLTDPPVFLFDFEGNTISATPDEVVAQVKMQIKILAATKRMPGTIPVSKYGAWVNSWATTAIDVEPPPGADFLSNLREMLLLFLDEAAERTGDEDRFFIGRVVTRDGKAYFPVRHFRKFLQRDGMRPKERELTEALKKLGCVYERARFNGKSARPWVIDPVALRAV